MKYEIENMKYEIENRKALTSRVMSSAYAHWSELSERSESSENRVSAVYSHPSFALSRYISPGSAG